MKIDNMKKEDLELLSHKDITNLLLEEKGGQNTADLFRKIIELLELPSSTFDNKIGDYFTSLTTDKRFIMLNDGNWDLQSRHQAVKLSDLEEDDEELEEVENTNFDEEDDENIDYEEGIDDDSASFDDEDDLSDLVVLDEDELELEQ